MIDVLIATANHGKANEIKEIFKDSPFHPHFLFDYPELMSIAIQENASSFEGNALIKALIIGQAAKALVLADDKRFVCRCFKWWAWCFICPLFTRKD
jgi:inosine/xanthosine triphosphate pyrophosphatase family protein